jgi:hypothetical protein
VNERTEAVRVRSDLTEAHNLEHGTLRDAEHASDWNAQKHESDLLLRPAAVTG